MRFRHRFIPTVMDTNTANTTGKPGRAVSRYDSESGHKELEIVLAGSGGINRGLFCVQKNIVVPSNYG